MTNKEREEACLKLLEEALKLHDCSIEAQVLVTAKGNLPILKVVANEAESANSAEPAQVSEQVIL
jgi:hypothetical protein